MKVASIIAEYNPFHNGHEFHINKVRQITGADYVVVIMSGNFVQRGEPAIIDKYKRTRMTLDMGADLIVELPVIFATASAQDFALGALSIIDGLGCVDYLCFGSECGDVEPLDQVASYLLENEDEFNKDINKYMKSGLTYPKARHKAIQKNNPDMDDKILSAPNNILAIEYIKAIKVLESKIKPITFTRKQSDHNDILLNINSTKKDKIISSASSLRHSISKSRNLDIIKSHVPTTSYKILTDEYVKTFPIYMNDFSLLLKHKLLQERKESLTDYIDVSNDLANRITNSSFINHDFLSYSKKLKTKQWTQTRINRSLIHILLNLKTKNLNKYKKAGYGQYARILGFNKNSSKLLREINKHSKIPLIMKMSKAIQSLSPLGLDMLNEDIFAADIYNLIIQEKFKESLANEFRQELIIVK